MHAPCLAAGRDECPVEARRSAYLGWGQIGTRQPCRPTVTPPLLPLTPPTVISCVFEAGSARSVRAWDSERPALAPFGGHYLILPNALQSSSHLLSAVFSTHHHTPNSLLHGRIALPLYAHHHVNASASSHILVPRRNHSSQRSLLVGLSSTLVLDHPESTATPPRFRRRRPR
jgi:hypothetical protein